jgi:hypothetical protein
MTMKRVTNSELTERVRPMMILRHEQPTEEGVSTCSPVKHYTKLEHTDGDELGDGLGTRGKLVDNLGFASTFDVPRLFRERPVVVAVGGVDVVGRFGTTGVDVEGRVVRVRVGMGVGRVIIVRTWT